MKRVVCALFPRWPLQRVLVARPELSRACLLLYGEFRRGAWGIVACARGAWRRGVRPGMSLAEARALVGSGIRPRLVRHDPAADRMELQRLAAWCARFSPQVGLAADDGLWLDVTGCAPLFRGEANLLHALQDGLQQQGYSSRLAVADTFRAAWAMCRFGTAPAVAAITIVPPGGQAEALHALPPTALDITAQQARALHELGLQTIGQLVSLPRSSLPSRFGPLLLERLDQALGQRDELLVPLHTVEPLRVERSFEEPVADRHALETIFGELLAALLQTLPERQVVQRLTCRIDMAGSAPDVQGPAAAEFVVGLVRGTAALRHLEELVSLKLERLPLPGPVGRVALEAAVAPPPPPRQSRLGEVAAVGEEAQELEVLLERLSSRLGKEAVVRPVPCPEAEPERACRFVPALEPLTWEGEAAAVPAVWERPCHLRHPPLAVEVTSLVPAGPPVQLRWQGQLQRIVRQWGPERIQTGWWHAHSAQRDYYRVETETGQWLWLFRDAAAGGWFLHGAFD